MSTHDDLAHAVAQYLAIGQTVAAEECAQRYVAAVPAELFNQGGKWKYSVKLDYRNHPGGYLAPHDNARRAFEQASALGTSGVTFKRIPENWTLVVPMPPEGFPVMIRGEAS